MLTKRIAITAPGDVGTNTRLTEPLSTYGYSSTEISGGLTPVLVAHNGRTEGLDATVTISGTNLVVAEGASVCVFAAGDVFLVDLIEGIKTAEATASTP